MEEPAEKKPEASENLDSKRFADLKMRIQRVLSSYNGQFRLNKSSFGTQLHHDILAYCTGSGKSLDELSLEFGLSIGQLNRLFETQIRLGTSFIKPFRGRPPPERIFKPIFLTTDGEKRSFNPDSPDLPDEMKNKNAAFRSRFNGAEVEFTGLETALFLIMELKK